MPVPHVYHHITTLEILSSNMVSITGYLFPTKDDQIQLTNLKVDYMSVNKWEFTVLYLCYSAKIKTYICKDIQCV